MKEKESKINLQQNVTPERMQQQIKQLQQRNQELQKENDRCMKDLHRSFRQSQMLQTLVNLLPNEIFVKDASSHFVMANQECARRLGVENPDELIGKSDFDFLPPEMAAYHYQSEQHLLKTGQPLIDEKWDNPKDSRWFLTTKIPLRDESGKATGLVGINTNISDLKQAIAKLQKSEETSQAVLNASPDIVTLLDDKGICLACNLNLIRLFNKNYEQVVGTNHFDHLPESVAYIRRKMLDRVLQLGFPVSFEDRYENDFYFHSLFPIRDGGPKVKRVAIFSKRITQEKETEKLRKRADQRLHAFVQALPDLTIIFDIHGNIVDAFSQPEQHNWFREQLQDGHRQLTDIFQSQTAEQIRNILQKTIENNSVQQIEFYMSVDGEMAWFQSRTFPVPVEKNETPLIVMICREVTSHKKLEFELMNISEKVTRQIGRDLHDDLGQYLTAVAWAIRMLAKELKEKQCTELQSAEKIQDQVQEIINKTRSLARGLNPVELDERGLRVALERLVEQTDRLPGLSCTGDLNDETDMLPPDASVSLYRIVQEALNNAIKHSGATRIQVSLTHTLDRVDLLIEDNGRGFSPASKESTGMGLLTMQHRVRLLGGELAVDSSVGGGTRIHVTTPLHPIP